MLKENRKTVRRYTGKLNMLTKVGMMTCIGLLLTFTTVYADDNGKLEKIYHVYVDGKHAGKVDDKRVIENVMRSKVEEKEEDFGDYTLTVGEEVSFVSERVFNPAYNNSKVSDQIKDTLSIKAEAVELKIADQSAGYFKNKETAENVLKQYKTKYADEEILEKLSAKEQEDSSPEYRQQALVNEKQDEITLDPGETVITNVMLSENVSFAEKKVDPADILTEKQGLMMLEKGTLEEKVHKVEKGEVLGDIAGKYDVTIDELLELNDGLEKDSILQIDQEIHVTDYKPFVDVIVQKEQMKKETIDYETEIIESDDLYKGDKEVKQEGQEGKKEVHYALEMTNDNVTNKEVVNEKTTKEPVKEIIIEGTKVVPSRGTGDLHWPTIGGYVSSNVGERWGSMHKGMDIARPSDRSILAADNGTVVSSGWDDGGYGNKIVISHNNGMKTVYAHLSSISVSSGETVEKGSKIGVMGSTGDSTGVHLHFEVYKNGALQNPQDYF
ncbi:Murein DD-endopeptidase MepM and murein hydrolase activator NlpD, contain LysM domain [Lentibacillus halodurans]|uniref:Murein DD-endopeptidase MepM and murein hydrolase activator NlpD, contain LysM domain n=1 Tax=Lentibacillus halodurans TaxID=237679 RepID=A0A1I1A0N3_9BACI|nr:peptidoglycan DD-metalloendopeptidase family protein [Lentibacillus halodurans]SFB30118.1 Murein DD-endopeptidase MepM and murein hydrolase activator NlpD, contain LysM domain [Lentibacillus halodurans]